MIIQLNQNKALIAQILDEEYGIDIDLMANKGVKRLIRLLKSFIK